MDSDASASETTTAEKGRLDLVLPILCGVAVAWGLRWALRQWVPAPIGNNSLVPYVLATFAGVLTSMRLALSARPKLKEAYRLTRIAFLLASTVVLVLLGGIQKEALHRSYTPLWSSITCAGALFTWLAAAVHERRAGKRLPTYTAVILGLCLAAMTMQQGHYMHETLSGNRARAWNAYHYYVGSKYFKELSYFDLYAATLAADDDWQAKKAATKNKKRKRRLKRVKDFRRIKKARDMKSYRIQPRKVIVDGFDRSKISEERLAELGADSRFFRRHMRIKSPGGWTNTFMDLGYNPAPPWTLLGTSLSNLIPAKKGPYWLLANSDIPLFIASFLVLWWAFGLRLAALCGLWVNAIQFNEARFVGGLFQYDWLASVALCLGFFSKGWYRSAGLALSWGAMTRVFPGFFIAPIVLQATLDLFRPSPNAPTLLQRIAPQRRSFLFAFSMACLLLFVGSHFTGRGLQTWPEWVEKIGRHSGQHAITSNQRIGVGRLALHEARPNRFWSTTRGKNRAIKLERAEPKKRALQLLALALLIPALLRRRDLDGMILMQFGVFAAVTLSRYYASTWAMVFLLGAGLSARGSPKSEDNAGLDSRPFLDTPRGLFMGGALLLIAALIYAETNVTTRYFMVNYAMYGIGCILCLSYLVPDIKAWWSERRAQDEDQALAEPPIEGDEPPAQEGPPLLA